MNCCVGAVTDRAYRLERESHLPLHRAAAALGSELTERDPSAESWVNRQIRIRRLRMIQDVQCIETNLQTLGFRNPESLAEVGIEAITAQTHNRVIPKVSSLPGLRMLQNNLNISGIRRRTTIAGDSSRIRSTGRHHH